MAKRQREPETIGAAWDRLFAAAEPLARPLVAVLDRLARWLVRRMGRPGEGE